MNGRWTVWILVIICVVGHSAEAQEGKFSIYAGTDMNMGKYTFNDATVDISNALFNPRISAEYIFSGGSTSVGVMYSSSKNEFDFDFDDGSMILEGTMEVSRTEILPFIRLGFPDKLNFRLGYRMYKYEYTNGELDETRDGNLTKVIREGEAKGNLSNGIDAELNLIFGDRFQFALMVGGSYFVNAEYTWQYRNLLEGGELKQDKTKLSAVSLKVAPGFTYRVIDNLRLYALYRIEATTWLQNDADKDEDYAGTDIVSGLFLGLRYTF